MIRLLFLVFAFCCLLACRNEKKRLPDIIESAPEQEPAAPTVYNQHKTFKGLFVVGKTVRSFQSCGNSSHNYFVIDSTHQMDDLYKTIFRNSPAFPYEYVYVEFRGGVEASDVTVAANGFDSSVVVYDILTFEQKNYRNTCIPYDFWGIGNNPDWSLQVSAKEGILALKDYANNTVYLFEYFAPKVVNDEVYTYASNNYATKTSITAIFKRMPCNDGASGNEYEYAATVIIDGKKYSGCGIRGEASF